MKNKNLQWQKGEVTAQDRFRLLKQRGIVVWLTGLSGSGKSTLAVALESLLIKSGHAAYRLDGDNIRHGLNQDLAFNLADRQENIRRVAEVAKLFQNAGLITLVSSISPLKAMRSQAKEIIGADNFLEIFVKASLEECQKRDPKGLYKKALQGEISNFTGISSPYEEPGHPDLILDTTIKGINECTEALMKLIKIKVTT